MAKVARAKKKVTSVRNMKPMCHEVYDDKAAVYKEQLPEKNLVISKQMQIDVQAFLDHKPKLPISILNEFCVWSESESKLMLCK